MDDLLKGQTIHDGKHPSWKTAKAFLLKQDTRLDSSPGSTTTKKTNSDTQQKVIYSLPKLFCCCWQPSLPPRTPEPDIRAVCVWQLPVGVWNLIMFGSALAKTLPRHFSPLSHYCAFRDFISFWRRRGGSDKQQQKKKNTDGTLQLMCLGTNGPWTLGPRPLAKVHVPRKLEGGGWWTLPQSNLRGLRHVPFTCCFHLKGKSDGAECHLDIKIEQQLKQIAAPRCRSTPRRPQVDTWRAGRESHRNQLHFALVEAAWQRDFSSALSPRD